MKGSLSNKIIIWTFVPTSIILVLVALIYLYTYQRMTENLVIERDCELTRLSARLLGSELSAYADPLADQYLAIFDGIIVFDARGQVLVAEPMTYEKRRPTWFKDLAIDEMLLNSGIQYSDIIYDASRNEQIIVVVMPIDEETSVPTGGIAGFFRLGARADNALFAGIENLRRRESSAVYLVDGNGRVIYHSEHGHIGETLATQETVQMVLQNWAGAYRTKDLEGRSIVASFAPVPGTPWGIVFEESWSELMAPTRHYGRLLFLLLGLGIVFPTVIVTIGVRRITQPITELIGAARDMAGGNFDRRISPSTHDEFEELAKQFNVMAGQLQASYARLQQKVFDRTKELATLNTIAAQVSQSLDLDDVVRIALDEVLGVMRMECGQLYRLQDSTDTLHSMVDRGLSPRFLQHTQQMPVEASPTYRANEESQPVVWQVDDYPSGELRHWLVEEGLSSVIGVPLMVHRRLVGAMLLGSREVRTITSEELSLLAAIGHQIGVALENARLYEQAQQLAIVKERNRLARDLHDSVTQALYGVTLYAEAASRQLGGNDVQLAADHLREIRHTAQESLREMRVLIFELRLPILQQEGLAMALQARLDAVESRLGLDTEFVAHGNLRLQPEIEESLYRIAQEALNNILKHAKANSVRVVLCCNKTATSLDIIDDGIGFDASLCRSNGGFGLNGMRERASRLNASLSVDSELGVGTHVRIEVHP